MILVTGATGQFGNAAIRNLKKKQPSLKIAALVRDPDKAGDLLELGVEVRQGDYNDYLSLEKAFDGIEKILLVSAPAFTDLAAQHNNVINAASAAGVKHIVFTSIQRKSNVAHLIPWVTENNNTTEEQLQHSGLKYTILRNTFYADSILPLLGNVLTDKGVYLPAGEGRVPFATRAELAEAAANVLAGTGHEDKIYTLTGLQAYSFQDVADILSQIENRAIPYNSASIDDYILKTTKAGFPAVVAGFWADWSEAFKAGDFEDTDNALTVLLKRKPVSLEEFLQTTYTKN